ncbi:MAG: TIGR04222 domain-containing membrane protein [Armatimonadetes bacterium]|nr:TIGR04222 domain-containing membrane protein [Armatimonadota bacterium]
MAWNHNPLADMYGPHFLLLYLCVIVATLAWVSLARRSLDRTGQERPPLVPIHPDPYEIAYLRGGENEVIRVAIFGLIQRGYLQIMPSSSRWNKEQRIGPSPGAPDRAFLSPLEQDMFAEFVSPRTAREIFLSLLPQRAKDHCRGYEQALRDERLLASDEQRQGVKRVAGTAALIILGLGGYKLAAALANGHSNVVFLFLMAVISLAVLAFVAQTRRLSRRGQAYLQSLQQAFERLKRPTVATENLAVDPLVLLVGVFGVGALVGTPQAAYGQMFAQSAASSGGGCGGSSGGCGGGGGGGGCGGGGDCGGCGGGG